MKTLLIIPAYNEEESLKNTVDSVLRCVSQIDLLVVNDGSRDGTVRVCRENNYPFLDLSTNLGLAGAFQAGMKYAYRHGYDCAIQFDADGQHLPEYIEPLVEATKTCDIAIGSRYIDKRKPISLRMLGSRLIQAAIKLTTGKRLTDPTSGMRAFNARMIEQMALGLNFGPEPDTVSYLIKRADAKVVEVPVEMAERAAGESYLNPWSSAVYMLRMAISILFIQFFRKRIGGEKK
ncbi:glycosyltransferase family 2 protein [Eggerthella sp. YY7918]|uniref:glycosyltransferase family 2 protein n=1 Tax=Eggerthella sp. (strain YY7918) TaxID=502558 RepID=UPI000217112D|nr:glycosyltransferase family 2 protein [Eggerthella sp. YY7918]BAK44107.1 glycosyltransferase involved in cell wall biogenesis [Eggerthella sp. YY7918]